MGQRPAEYILVTALEAWVSTGPSSDSIQFSFISIASMWGGELLGAALLSAFLAVNILD